jgi:hypothetical protein
MHGSQWPVVAWQQAAVSLPIPRLVSMQLPLIWKTMDRVDVWERGMVRPLFAPSWAADTNETYNVP